MTVTDGVYKVARLHSDWNNASARMGETEMQIGCWQSASASKGAATTEAILGNTSNNQCVHVTTSNGRTTFEFANSGMVLDIPNGNAVAGVSLRQWTSNNSAAQQWTLTDTGDDQAFNGASYDLFNVFSAANDQLLCAENPDNSYVVLASPSPDDDSQELFLLKDSYYDSSLPVPASIGAAQAMDDGSYQLSNKVVWESGMASFIPGWVCSGSLYQLRYRLRAMPSGEDYWDYSPVNSGWTAPDGSQDDAGWGDAWSSNTTCDAAANVKVGGAVPIDLTGYDKMDCILQVRRWDGRTYRTGFTGGHGAIGSAYIHIYRKAVVTIDSAIFTPYGLQITYTSDYRRNNNSITFSNVKYHGEPFCDDITVENAPYTGTVTIPLSGAFQVPLRGESVVLDYSLTTQDGVTSEYTGESVEVTWDGGTLTVGVRQTVDGNNTNITITGGPFESETVYLVYTNDGRYWVEECAGDAGSFKVLPPLNKPYSLICVVTGANDTWGIQEIEGTVVESMSYVWDWDDNEVSMFLFIDQFGVLVSDYTRSTNAFSLNGRDFQSVYFDTNSTSNMRITGAVPLEEGTRFGDCMDDFFRLRRADYALFRDPDGGRHHVAVTAMNHERHDREFYKVIVTMKERS